MTWENKAGLGQKDIFEALYPNCLYCKLNMAAWCHHPDNEITMCLFEDCPFIKAREECVNSQLEMNE